MEGEWEGRRGGVLTLTKRARKNSQGGTIVSIFSETTQTLSVLHSVCDNVKKGEVTLEIRRGEKKKRKKAKTRHTLFKGSLISP